MLDFDGLLWTRFNISCLVFFVVFFCFDLYLFTYSGVFFVLSVFLSYFRLDNMLITDDWG